jgi:hypothetical protein
MDMYKRLGGPDASLVTPLTLRTIAYVVNDIGPENEVRNREVPLKALISHMGTRCP